MSSGATATRWIAGVLAAIAVALALFAFLSSSGWLLPDPMTRPLAGADGSAGRPAETTAHREAGAAPKDAAETPPDAVAALAPTTEAEPPVTGSPLPEVATPSAPVTGGQAALPPTRAESRLAGAPQAPAPAFTPEPERRPEGAGVQGAVPAESPAVPAGDALAEGGEADTGRLASEDATPLASATPGPKEGAGVQGAVPAESPAVPAGDALAEGGEADAGRLASEDATPLAPATPGPKEGEGASSGDSEPGALGADIAAAAGTAEADSAVGREQPAAEDAAAQQPPQAGPEGETDAGSTLAPGAPPVDTETAQLDASDTSEPRTAAEPPGGLAAPRMEAPRSALAAGETELGEPAPKAAGAAPAEAPGATGSTPDATAGGPRLDIVRVERDGAALVAGTAAPNSIVSITLDGQTIDEAVAGPDGSFVAFVDLPRMDAPRPLRLQSERAGDLRYSEQTVLIVPPAQDEAEAQPAVVVADSAGVRLVQPEVPVASDAVPDLASAGADALPARALPLALDTITYDATGEVTLSGRGAGKGYVRIYVDNTPLTTEPVPADGNWRATLPDLDKGTYTLRVDQIDASGAVVARVESPFKRESPAALAEAARNSGVLTSVTVQPGHTLWAIARDRYGSGFRYVQIFRANRDKIRDPDLIYPGQVFDLPPDPAE